MWLPRVFCTIRDSPTFKSSYHCDVFCSSSEDDVDDIDIKKGVDISLKIYTAIHFRSNSNSKVILDYGWIQQLPTWNLLGGL